MRVKGEALTHCTWYQCIECISFMECRFTEEGGCLSLPVRNKVMLLYEVMHLWA